MEVCLSAFRGTGYRGISGLAESCFGYFARQCLCFSFFKYLVEFFLRAERENFTDRQCRDSRSQIAGDQNITSTNDLSTKRATSGIHAVSDPRGTSIDIYGQTYLLTDRAIDRSDLLPAAFRSDTISQRNPTIADDVSDVRKPVETPAGVPGVRLDKSNSTKQKHSQLEAQQPGFASRCQGALTSRANPPDGKTSKVTLSRTSSRQETFVAYSNGGGQQLTGQQNFQLPKTKQ